MGSHKDELYSISPPKTPNINGNGKKENSMNNKKVYCRFIFGSPIIVILFCLYFLAYLEYLQFSYLPGGLF